MRDLKKSMGTIGILLLFSATALFANMRGHDSAWCAQNIRTYGFLAGGAAGVNLGDINNDLNTRGLSSFREYAGTVSLGMQKQIGRLTMESALTSLFWKDQVNLNTRTSIWMGNILWNTGFNILPDEFSLALFPLAGLGVGLNTISVRSDEKTFAQVLASSQPAAMLWQTAFLINLGLGTDLKISNQDNTKGLVLGLRGGYVFDLFDKSQWTAAGVKVIDLASMSQQGAYVRFVLGSWGHKR